MNKIYVVLSLVVRWLDLEGALDLRLAMKSSSFHTYNYVREKMIGSNTVKTLLVVSGFILQNLKIHGVTVIGVNEDLDFLQIIYSLGIKINKLIVSSENGSKECDASKLNSKKLILYELNLRNFSQCENLCSVTLINCTTSKEELFSLVKLTSLRVLKLENLKIQVEDNLYKRLTDASFLKYCTNIRKLHLEDLCITDISHLSECTNLSVLEIQYLNITTLGNVKKLINLKRLKVMSNLTDLSDISGMTSLSELTAGLNITCLTSISALQNLRTLDLNNNMRCCGLLPVLKNIVILNISFTGISDISNLRYSPFLRKFNAACSEIADISALTECTYLANIDIRQTAVSDISSLEKLPKLKKLNIAYTEVTELPYLKNLIELNYSKSTLKCIPYLPNLRRVFTSHQYLDF